MGTKHFQVPSDGVRLQASLTTPEHGEAWPWVVLSHAGRTAKDSAFFDGFVEPLVERGLAVCRYDPRAPHSDFWTRWSDLSALLQHLARDYAMPQTALAGTGLGAVLSMWWAAVHKGHAVVCFGFPAPMKLGTVPRVMHDYLPPEQTEEDVVPHPTGLTRFLALVGERDPEGAQRAETFGAEVQRIPGGDKTFSAVRARQAAFERAAGWLGAVLHRPAHQHAAVEERGSAIEKPASGTEERP